MTIAELHGKLAPDRPMGVHEGMEDLLTSDVFGSMKYAGWNYGFLEWFLKAEPAPITPSPPPIKDFLLKDEITAIDYAFWPTLRNKREPDLAMLFSFALESPMLVLVESKYFSGTSDWDCNEEVSTYGLTGNQIADQVKGLSQMSDLELMKWFGPSHRFEHSNEGLKITRIHLFITTHASLPVQDYEYSKKHIKVSWPINSYWLSWSSLARCLEGNAQSVHKGTDALIGDLQLLLKKKGLVPFDGFKADALNISRTEGSFWVEKWWTTPPLETSEYESFWHKAFWQIDDIGPLPKGPFWKVR